MLGVCAVWEGRLMVPLAAALIDNAERGLWGLSTHAATVNRNTEMLLKLKNAWRVLLYGKVSQS